MPCERVRVHRARAVLAGLIACAILITAAPLARAQSVTAGTIRGKAADETGAALVGALGSQNVYLQLAQGAAGQAIAP